jgi:hypothetical protein
MPAPGRRRRRSARRARLPRRRNGAFSPLTRLPLRRPGGPFFGAYSRVRRIMDIGSEMRALFLRSAIALSFTAAAWLAFGQGGGSGRPAGDVQLPNGKSQRAEILKAEREQNIKEAAQIVELAKDLQQELEKNESYVLSMASLKKTDEIEKLAKRIRGRLRHY